MSRRPQLPKIEFLYMGSPIVSTALPSCHGLSLFRSDFCYKQMKVKNNIYIYLIFMLLKDSISHICTYIYYLHMVTLSVLSILVLACY